MDVLAAHYSAVCPACGLEVLSPGPETGLSPAVLIGATWVAVPEYARAPGVKHAAIHEVICSGQNGNVFIAYEDARKARFIGTLARRSVPDDADHVTLFSVGFLPDGRAWWQSGFETYSVEGEPDRPIPGGTSVMGCLGNPEIAANWMTGQPPPVFGGQTFFNPSYSDDGDWVSGQPHEPIQLVYHFPTDTLWNAGPTYNAPVACRLVMVNWSPVVCRNYPSGTTLQHEFTPYVAPEPVPPDPPDPPDPPEPEPGPEPPEPEPGPEPPIPPDPQPEPEPPLDNSTFVVTQYLMESRMQLQEVIGPAQLNDVGNEEFTVSVDNPLPASYAGLPEAETTLYNANGEELEGKGLVLSIGPGGNIEVRPKGTAGGFEKCVKQGNLLVYKTDNRRFVLPFAE